MTATPEERQAAQDWLAANTGELDPADLLAAIQQVYGDGASLGTATATQLVGGSVTDLAAEPAADWAAYWDAWTPGNPAAASLLDSGGLARLLDSAQVTVNGIVGTTLDRLGGLLADGAAAGDSVDTIARSLLDVVADPARAFLIGDTELNRAVSAASIDTYRRDGVGAFELIVSPDACDICEQAGGDNPHNLDDLDATPPLHPRCRCAVSPVTSTATSAGGLATDLAEGAAVASLPEDIAAYRGIGQAMSNGALKASDIRALYGEQAKPLLSALKTWESDNYGALQRNVVRYLQGDTADVPTNARALAEALRGAEANAPQLYRGLHFPPDTYDRMLDDVFAAGKTVDLPVSSFSSDASAGVNYAAAGSRLGEQPIILQVEPGSVALNGEAAMTRYGGANSEWVSGGRYEVIRHDTIYTDTWGNPVDVDRAALKPVRGQPGAYRGIAGEVYARTVVVLRQVGRV